MFRNEEKVNNIDVQDTVTERLSQQLFNVSKSNTNKNLF